MHERRPDKGQRASLVSLIANAAGAESGGGLPGSGNAFLYRVARYLWENPVVPFFILYFIVCAVAIPGFARIANLSTIFIQSSFLSILSIGLTFVVINGGIDFSVVGVMGLSSIAGAAIMRSGSSDSLILAALGAMLAIGIVVGCINGFAVTVLNMPSFIATMATQLIFSGLALWSTKSTTLSNLPAAFVHIGQGSLLGIPFPVVAAIVLAGIAFFVLHGSVFGRYLMAVGTNQKASRISGLPVERTIFSVFVLSGVFASIAAILMTAKVASGIPMMGDRMIMDIVAAVLIGGTSISGGRGSIVGTVIGALLVIILNNSLYLLGVEWFVITVLKGLMVLFVAILEILRNRKEE